MRLFIASGFSDEMKKALSDVSDAIRRLGVRGNYTKEINYHLTLAFIGEYGDPSKVLSAMRRVPLEKQTVSLSAPGRFGDLWWCGLDIPQAFTDYVYALRSSLRDAGIPFDQKKFTPHVTLLRRADRLFEAPAVPEAETVITRVCLMRSDRSESGMIYTPLGHVAAR